MIIMPMHFTCTISLKKIMRSNTALRECMGCGEVLPINRFDSRHKCIRCRNLWRKYQITQQEFLFMLENQLHSCLICEKPINEKTACVDHCHDTSVVRSLLCNNCNIAVGHLKHDKHITLRAYEYLNKHT